MQADLRIPFPCPLVIRGGSNLPKRQELVGMFAYRLVSGHWLVLGVARMREEGTVTTVASCRWPQSRAGRSRARSGWTWHGLPCVSMWGGCGVRRGG